MILEATPLAGVLVVRPEPHADSRGLFARTYCRETFASAGVDFTPLQMSTSFNRVARTLRGLHWQEAPHGEAKLVRVTRGAMFDVAVDLRPSSPTYKKWFGLELSAENRMSLFIPAGFAHGFVTFEDETEVAYAIDTAYAPAAGRGARFDDPAFAITWPAAPVVVGERDLAWPAFEG
ncbi:dTDP-4-dehydrorhamnose 3,5-epimerase [Microvirga terricola]|uniref:dTDP-4-dehydrorhamnose 3,5-epimerase n=1 Tax=Microvirga terricola TaxID=2719797 RepID=A0ABX0VH40_9HYPH|nr:dTDP-4-dehydrorhamnose 3,5-epimerase [Microvirga terricola]NIX77547.1 dTDP-4-dehydrorhamnose 3,5-epimerase [Microvirga terricola]